MTFECDLTSQRSSFVASSLMCAPWVTLTFILARLPSHLLPPGTPWIIVGPRMKGVDSNVITDHYNNLIDNFRNYKLWRILFNPRNNWRKERRRNGYIKKRQDAVTRREEDGEVEGQASHGWWPWVSEEEVWCRHMVSQASLLSHHLYDPGQECVVVPLFYFIYKHVGLCH